MVLANSSNRMASQEGTQPPTASLPVGVREGSLEKQARTAGDAVAIVDGEQQITWAQWDDMSNRVAHSLRRLGIREGNVVALRMRVRHEWCVVYAAAAKLGCRLLCLNWHLTPAEVAYIIENGGARAIICDDIDPSLLQVAWEKRDDMIAVSVDTQAPGFLMFEELMAGPAVPIISTRGTETIIYTSGTTGLPKGVARQAVEPSDRIRKEYGEDVDRKWADPSDVVLLNVPLHHGMGTTFVRIAIEFGQKLVLMRRFDPEAVLATIAVHKVTFWFAVPTMFKRIGALPDEILKRHDLSSMRLMVTGGSPVPYEIKMRTIDIFGECLSEAYGSTETGMISFLRPGEQRTKPGSCGQLYQHVSVSIRDAEEKPLSVGDEGEIWVKTPTVISGYVGKLLSSDTLDEQGYFRMGDVGRLDTDGYLYITDRVKDMIISGGVNIYPAEIERVLQMHSDVMDAAVIGTPDDDFGERVTAFVEPVPGKAIVLDELLEFCKSNLASYKVPRSIDVVETLPRNPMGKVLKADLRRPFWAGRDRKV